METEVHDYAEGGLNTHTWKFATRTKQSPLVLKRGIVNKVLWDWYHDISIGKMKFRNATIILFDHDGVLVDTEFWYYKAGERALADIGVTLDKADPETLATLFSGMTDARYQELAAAVGAIDRSQWVTSPADCRALVQRLAALGRNASSPAPAPVVSTQQS